MRSDMEEVMGGSRGYQKLRSPKGNSRENHLPHDELPTREKIRYRWRNQERDKPSFRIQPLKRYLRSNVDRPWGKVYAEIRATIKDHRILEDLQWLVAKEIEMVNGLPMSPRKSRWGSHKIWSPFFVHPKTGSLTLNVTYWERSHRTSRRQIEYVPKDDHHQYRLINGIWYVVRMMPLPATTRDEKSWWWTTGVPDIIIGGSHNRQKYIMTYGAPVYAVAKKQANKREIKKILPQAIILGLIPSPEVEIPNLV